MKRNFRNFALEHCFFVQKSLMVENFEGPRKQNIFVFHNVEYFIFWAQTRLVEQHFFSGFKSRQKSLPALGVKKEVNFWGFPMDQF